MPDSRFDLGMKRKRVPSDRFDLEVKSKRVWSDRFDLGMKSKRVWSDRFDLGVKSKRVWSDRFDLGVKSQGRLVHSLAPSRSGERLLRAQTILAADGLGSLRQRWAAPELRAEQPLSAALQKTTWERDQVRLAMGVEVDRGEGLAVGADASDQHGQVVLQRHCQVFGARHR